MTRSRLVILILSVCFVGLAVWYAIDPGISRGLFAAIAIVYGLVTVAGGLWRYGRAGEKPSV